MKYKLLITKSFTGARLTCACGKCNPEVTIDESMKEDLVEEIDVSLSVRFDEEDLNAIKGVINDKFPSVTTLEAKPDALNLISDALHVKLKETDTFHLFTLWENLINKAAGTIVKNYSTLHETDQYWQDNYLCTVRIPHT